MLRALLTGLLGLLNRLRWFVVAILGLGLPLFLYLVFFAKEPVFQVEDDVLLGQQSAAAIAEDPAMPVLAEADYPALYGHMRRIVRNVVQSPEVLQRETFAYDQVKVIHDDGVLNAFCVPGGFIYVFTGILRYLDAEDHLAGVLGHEIAHAEKRHSSLRLQRQFGVKRLSEFVLLSQPLGVSDVIHLAILRDLLDLRYSREQEAQSDEYSVRYLAGSGYACDGAAGFFAKLIDEGDGARLPAFLSDHPDPAARVRDIRDAARRLGCSTEPSGGSTWRQVQASLPPPRAAKEDGENGEPDEGTEGTDGTGGR